MKTNIFCIVGKAATGKSTVEIELAKKYNRVISYTTRPMRSNEVDGVDYHFIDDEKYDELDSKGVFLEKTEYMVAGQRFRYALPRTGIKDDEINIVVVNPHGLTQLIQVEDIRKRMGIIYIKSPLLIRTERYLKRETSEKKYKNFCERLIQDEKDFKIIDDDSLRSSVNGFATVNNNFEGLEKLCGLIEHKMKNL